MSYLKNVEEVWNYEKNVELLIFSLLCFDTTLNCLYFHSFVFWHNSGASYLGVFKWVVVPVLMYLIVLICM
jgi:hypothetical protein